MLLYADDIVIYVSGNSFDDIFVALQTDLNKLNDWSVANKLSLSPSKTKAMITGRKLTLKKTQVYKQLTIGKHKVEFYLLGGGY